MNRLEAELFWDAMSCYDDLMKLFGHQPRIKGCPRVKFKDGRASDLELYPIGKTDGPIATREQYENFKCSYAHLHEDGRVCRFDEDLGTRDDLIIEPTP